MKSKITSVLIINYHSSLNSGDRALLETNILQIKNAFQPATITVAVNWPNESYFNNSIEFQVVPSLWQLVGSAKYAPAWIQIIRSLGSAIQAYFYKWGLKFLVLPGWRKLYDAYNQAEIIVSVSGTHFYTTGKYGWPFPLKALMVEIAHIFQKPLYIMPQSIGPRRWKWEQNLLNSVYNRARVILLRDQASMRLAAEINLPSRHVFFAPDPAFAFQESGKEKALNILRKYGYKDTDLTIGFTLIPWQGRWLEQSTIQNYFRCVANVFRRTAKEFGVKVYLFNQVTGPTPFDDDRLAAQSLIEIIGKDAKWFTYVDEILTPGDLKACYGCMDLFLASRMHSGIFALSMNVPVVFIGYISKTKGLMERLGLDDWVINLEDLDEEKLWAKIQTALVQRNERTEHLRSIIPPVIQAVNSTYQKLKEDYESMAR